MQALRSHALDLPEKHRDRAANGLRVDKLLCCYHTCFVRGGKRDAGSFSVRLGVETLCSPCHGPTLCAMTCVLHTMGIHNSVKATGCQRARFGFMEAQVADAAFHLLRRSLR